MPYKRKYKKRTPARRRRRAVSKIPRGIMPNNSKVVKLKYSDDWNLLPTTADIPYKAFFSACSLYDPDRTGGGHQPKMFDQMCTYYNHYTVLSAKISVRCINTPSVPMMVFITKTDSISPGALGTKNQLLEADNTRYCYLSNDTLDKTITSSYSKKKTFGKSATDKLTASATTNPADEIFWQVSAINTKAGETPNNVPIVVNIEYVALFTERVQIDLS